MAFRWFLLLDSACAGHAVEDPMRSGIMRNLNFARTDFSSFSEKEVEGVIFYGGMKEDSLLDKILKKIQRNQDLNLRSPKHKTADSSMCNTSIGKINAI